MWALSLLLLVTTGVSAETNPYYVVSKRTLASSNGSVDQQFWNAYFGPTDPSSTQSSCLDRWLQHAAPDNIGVHFPTSTVTPDVPVSAGGVNDTMSLSRWDSFRNSLHQTAVEQDRKTAFHDHATVFFVPDLGPHVTQFNLSGVPFLSRSYSLTVASTMYVVMTVSPGNGHTLELQAPKCTGCGGINFRAFGDDECAASHMLDRPLAYYEQAWQTATQLSGWQTELPGTHLPTPLMMQMRAAVLDGSEAVEYADRLLPKAQVDDMTHATGHNTSCRVVEFTVGTEPFAATRQLYNYSMPLRFTQNTAAWSNGYSWADWTEWVKRLHSEYVGEGWGFDRVLDYHIKINTQDDQQQTETNVTLDQFAAVHEHQARRYHAFNTSQACPGTWSPPFGGYMMYSEGIEGTSGFELWGHVDRTFFKDTQLYAWNSCSPSMGCMYKLPDPACSISSPSGVARAMVPSDWPTNLASLQLSCAPGATVSRVNFASFGTPEGSCQAGFRSGSCHADTAMKVVERLCLGKRNCTVPTEPTLYGGDVCPEADWPVSLAVELECAN